LRGCRRLSNRSGTPGSLLRDGLKDHPERYWIPLIGLFYGMRLNEIYQLHLEDIREEGGLLCFDINKKGDKELKTASSRRLIHVHPVLLDLGFKEYVDAEEEARRVWNGFWEVVATAARRA
jgi:integrase